jgi:hypothetical protein
MMELFWGEQPPLVPVGCGRRYFFAPILGVRGRSSAVERKFARARLQRTAGASFCPAANSQIETACGERQPFKAKRDFFDGGSRSPSHWGKEIRTG